MAAPPIPPSPGSGGVLTARARPPVALKFGATASAYDPDAVAYFASMTVQPDATRKGLINSAFLSLKAAGVYAKLDTLHLVAAHDAQAARLNIKGAAYSLTVVNAPTFTVDRGYQGDGVSASLVITGYNPSVADGKLYTLDSAAVGAWANAHPAPTTANTSALIGTNGADGGPRMIPLSAASQMQCRMNQTSSSTNVALAANTRLGFHGMSRPSAAGYDAYAGSATPIPVAVVSSSPIGATQIGFFSQSGSLFSQDRVGATFAGGGLSQAEMASVYNTLNTYLTAIGAN